MATKRKKNKKSFWQREKQGAVRVGKTVVQAGKEVSSIAAYAGRELTGQRHRVNPRCSLKKGWFE